MEVAQVYAKAGFPHSHGEAFQEIANEGDRIITSRCAQEIGIQLLEENYASKGFGIKAKSCDWGPFAGFAMGHFQYSKFETGIERYQKQIKFFKNSGHTGFHNVDVHIKMAQPETLRLTTARLRQLCQLGKITIEPDIRDKAALTCNGPYGPLVFGLADLGMGSDARWGLWHHATPPNELKALAREHQGTVGVDAEADWTGWSLVKGMVNLLAEDRNLSDPAKNCVAGDYDLWGVFPAKGSSMAKHGMERQARIFAGANPNASPGILARVANLQNDAFNSTPERTYSTKYQGSQQDFRYQENPELGNASALLVDTMHKLNRRIKDKGYRGGRMVHHNDDMGNPFRSDVESNIIAFIPGDRAYFIEDAGYYGFIKKYHDKYLIYDNMAIWGKR